MAERVAAETATEAAPDVAAQWRKLFDYVLGYQATWIVDAGLRAGLFRAIADAPASGIQDHALAASLGYAPRYVEVWCRAAFAFELLEWDEQHGYRLAPHLDTLLLDPSTHRFLGGRFQFTAALYQDFRALPEFLASGEHWPRSAHDPWLLEALRNNSKPDPGVIAEAVARQAPRAAACLEQGGTLLDLGAGAGYAVVHYAARFPRARIVGLEYDGASVELARQAVAAAALGERVEIRHADANLLAEDAVYDLVTLNIALHEMGGEPEFRNVLARARQALKPGGTIAVSELPYPDSPRAYREEPVLRMLAGVQVHEAIVGCGAITRNQLRALLEEAGFADVRVAEQPLPTRFMMLAERVAR